MKIIKSIAVLACLFVFSSINAQGVVGTWVTIDDETNEPKSHVEIYEKDGKLFGKVVKLLPAATTDICNDCPDGKAGKKLVDIDIVEDLKPYKDYYSYGSIVDPANGKKYKCNVWLEDGNLNVRGYIGVSALGRTQVWKPLQ